MDASTTTTTTTVCDDVGKIKVQNEKVVARINTNNHEPRGRTYEVYTK
jgi:hypothetical protein